MIRIGVIGSDETRVRLEATAHEAGVECLRSEGENDSVAGVVVESEYLSLRLVASCDARSLPFAVLAVSERVDAVTAFGIETSLSHHADWPEILEALGLGRSEASSLSQTPPPQSGLEENSLRDARVIAVWGPAGAPGRSTIAINIASEAALLGKSVLLIDADTYGGSIAGYLELFDEAPGFLAASRLAGQERLDEKEIARLTHSFELGSTSFSVMSGIVSARRWPELTAVRVRACLGVLRPYFDVIVCDVGFNLEQDEEISSDLTAPRRNQATLQILSDSDAVVAVTSADVIGIARFIQTLESLKSSIRVSDISVVANRVRDSRAANASVVKHTLHRFAGIADVCVVAEDRQTFTQAVDLAVPLCVSAPKSAVRGQLAELAQDLARGPDSRRVASTS